MRLLPLTLLMVCACCGGVEGIPCDEAKRLANDELQTLYTHDQGLLTQMEQAQSRSRREDAAVYETYLADRRGQVEALAQARDAMLVEGYSELADEKLREGIESAAAGRLHGVVPGSSQLRAAVMQDEQLRTATASAQTVLRACSSGGEAWPLGETVSAAIGSEPAMVEALDQAVENAIAALRSGDPSAWTATGASSACQLLLTPRGVRTPGSLGGEDILEDVRSAFESCREQIDFATATIKEVESPPYLFAVDPCEMQDLPGVTVKLDVGGEEKLLELREIAVVGSQIIFTGEPRCR